MYDYDRRRWAMEHATPEARKDHLREHPNADPKNHTVSESKDGKPSSPKAMGKGGPGKQRRDWVKHLNQDFRPTTPKRQQALKDLQDLAEKMDTAEKAFDEDGGEVDAGRRSRLKQLFTRYNNALEETFGDGYKEKVPSWEAPNAKPKDSEAPKAKEPAKGKGEPKDEKKDEKKPPERKKAPRSLSDDVEDEVEKKHGIIDDIEFDRRSEDKDEWVYFVNTEKAELSVVIDRESGKVKKIEVDKDLEEDDYRAGRKKRKGDNDDDDDDGDD